jgi:hypothetical protein
MKKSLSVLFVKVGIFAVTLFIAGNVNKAYAQSRTSSDILPSASLDEEVCNSSSTTLSSTSTYTCYERLTFPSGVSLVGINNNSDVVGYAGYYGDSTVVILPSGSDEFVTLDFNGMATDINDNGVVVGIKFVNDNTTIHNTKGFILSEGILTEVDSSHVNITHLELMSVNNRGDIAGTAYISSGYDTCRQSIFVRKDENGSYPASIDLYLEPCDSQNGYGPNFTLNKINNKSVIVGNSGSWNYTHAMKIIVNEMMPRNAFPSDGPVGNSYAQSINDNNDIVGHLIGQNYSDKYPLALVSGQLISLTLPSGNGTGEAMDINNYGEIVGYQYPTSYINNNPIAFIHKDGQTKELDDLLCSSTNDGTRLTHAFKINDRGEIIAQRSNTNYYTTSFELLKPKTVEVDTGGGTPTGGSCSSSLQ